MCEHSFFLSKALGPADAGFRDSKIQRVQRFTGSEIQRLEGSEIQKFRDSKIQRFKDSEIRRFEVSEVQRFRDSEIQRWTQFMELECASIRSSSAGH